MERGGSTAMSPLLLLLLVLVLVLAVSPWQAAGAAGGGGGRGTPRVPALLVFGDSIVDTGNNNAVLTLTKSNFRPYGKDLNGGVPTGRFSNGRVPTDFVGTYVSPLLHLHLPLPIEHEADEHCRGYACVQLHGSA